jgi:hypothetical protein
MALGVIDPSIHISPEHVEVEASLSARRLQVEILHVQQRWYSPNLDRGPLCQKAPLENKWCGWQTAGSAPDENRVQYANKRDGYTMALFSSQKGNSGSHEVKTCQE